MAAHAVIPARRFWTRVAVAPEAGGVGVLLDDRPLRTPAQAPLVAPTRAFAEAVAAEWRAVEGELRPEALPFTRAANVAIDRVAPARSAVAGQIAAYGGSDLLCYRATEPEGLRRRQAAGWDPPLAWAAAALGAPLRLAEGVVHRPQPPASLAALRAALEAEDAFTLTALHEIAAVTGSVVLALGVARGTWSAEAAWRLARIDETWQAEQWGEDAEAAAAAARLRADLMRAARMLEMLAPG